MDPIYSRIRLLVVYGLVLLPLIIWGAIQALESTNNSPIDWVDASFQQRKKYDDFVELFGPGDAVVASWPECYWTDERLDTLVRELRESPVFRAADGSPYFHQVSCGREAILQMTTPQRPPSSGDEAGALTAGSDDVTAIAATVKQPRISVPDAIRRLQGTLIGKDGRTTSVIVILNKAGLVIRADLVQSMRTLIQETCGVDEADLHLVGPVVDGLTVDAAAHASLTNFAGPSAFIIFAICWWSLRSFAQGCIVFLTAALCQGIILATIYYSGEKLSALLIILPPLVQVLTVSGGIHLMNYYHNALETMEPKAAAIQAFREGWLPSVLSLGTTAMGTASLMVSGLQPIRLFGIYGTVGVLTATAAVLTVVPCSMMIFGRKKQVQNVALLSHTDDPSVNRSNGHRSRFRQAADRFWEWLAQLLRRRNTLSLVVLFGMMILTSTGLPRLKPSIRIETLFLPNSRIMQDYRWLEAHIGPLVPIEVILSFDKDCRLNERRRMELLWRVNDVLLKQPHVRASLSALTFFPTMPKMESMPATLRSGMLNKAIFMACPSFEAMNVLRSTDNEELWRITAHVSSLDLLDYGDLLNQIEAAVLHELFPPSNDAPRTESASDLKGVEVFTSGIMPLVHEIQGQLLTDLSNSLLSALIVITVTMTLAQAGFWAGLVSMASNIFPIVIAFGVMGLIDHPMDIGSVMTASIALGIAVDDTLHFLAFFRRMMQQPGATRFSAVLSGYQHCGLAMIQTSVSCGLGLLVFALSDFVPTSRFAVLMAFLLLLALLGDLLLLPALLLSPAGKLFESADKKREASG
ncbi:MAG: efflux RND transporter permease subunit [Planctomycetota bacterium]